MSDEADQPFAFLRRGILFIISAPSGAGKTTLSRQILDLVLDLRLSISYTTRAPRAGEMDGRDYHFVSEGQFIHLRAAGAFAEWAKVYGFHYGTARAPLNEALIHGHDLLLDIDVQGARQIRARYRADAVMILNVDPGGKVPCSARSHPPGRSTTASTRPVDGWIATKSTGLPVLADDTARAAASWYRRSRLVRTGVPGFMANRAAVARARLPGPVIVMVSDGRPASSRWYAC